MAGSNGDGFAVGGMGLNTFTPDLEANPLALSPDLRGPSPDTAGVYRGMYNPLAPLGRAAGSAATTTAPASNFDLGFGDSIAGQQIHSNIPGVGQGRMWGYLGPQYDAKKPAPFDIWQTAGVGDPPQRILERAKYMLEQNPDYFRGKNMFLTVGSNDPSQIEATKSLFQTLKDAGVGNVVVPGMGPKVPDSVVMNKALQSAVEGAGSNFKFFQPQIDWAGDGVHPRNSQQMFDQANTTLSSMLEPAPAGPGGLQVGGALQPQPTPINPLVPVPGSSAAPAAPIYPTWGGYIRDKEGFLGAVGDDVGYPSIGYGHLITEGEQKAGNITGIDEAGNRIQIPVGSINRDQGEAIFRKDVGDSIDAWRKVIPDFDNLTGLQKEALVSYHYNTGHTIDGMADAVKTGDWNKAAELLRSGIATVHHVPNEALATRREQEAQMMLGNEVPAYGYTSGQHVPGTGYSVGGRAVTPFATPRLPLQGPLPDVQVAAQTPGAGGGPAVSRPDAGGINDAAMRRAMILSMVGQMMQGRKFTPIAYDPFKVHEAGVADPALGGHIPSVEGYRPMQSPVQSVGAARPISVSIGRQQKVRGLV